MATTCLVTATITDPSQTSLLGNSFVRFRLRNFEGFIPVVAGSNVVCESQINTYPNPAGAISQTLITNTAISPANTFYTVEFWNQGRVISSANYVFNANTDLNTASNLNPAPAPTGTSAIIFENNGVLNSSQTLFNVESTDGSVTITDKGAGSINLQSAVVAFNTAGQGGFWSAGLDETAPLWAAFTASAPSSVINQVTVFQFVLGIAYTIRTTSISVVGGQAGGTANFGIYSMAGNKLLDSGIFSTAVGSTQLSNTLGAPVVLSAGTYYFAQSASATVPTVTVFNLGSLPLVKAQALAAGIYAATAANSTSGGVMPSTLGALSSATYIGNAANMAACFFGV